MSGEFEGLIYAVQELGFNVIQSESIDVLPPFERNHADMQALKIGDTVFILKDCERLSAEIKNLGYNVINTESKIKGKYPENVLLNAVYLNGKLYGRLDSLDKSLIAYCKNHSIDMINVKQGYTKCSTATIGGGFITSDRGVFDAMLRNREEGLLIECGDIELKGVDYGFIGGCCFEYDNTVYMTGVLNNHKNKADIENYIKYKNKKIQYLSTDSIYDIGGFVVL